MTSNTSAACPDETVLFTCTVSGTVIGWDLTPPPGANLGFTTESLSLSIDVPSGRTTLSPLFVFQGEIIYLSDGMVTATLITVTDVSVLKGSMVVCQGVSTQEGPLNITVAGKSLFLPESCSLVLISSLKQTSLSPSSESLPLTIGVLLTLSHRFSLISTESKSLILYQPALLLYCDCGVGPSLFSWWCVCQLCPHHLPTSSVPVTTHF